MNPNPQKLIDQTEEQTNPNAAENHTAGYQAIAEQQGYRSKWWSYIPTLIFCAIIYALALAYPIFSHDNIHSVDGMFHIRYAWLYRQYGIFTDFPWMQYAIAQDLWADHHLLYHILLIPFTIGDLLFGMKLASVVFATLALLACTLYLIGHRVRFVWIYAICLLLASDIFLFRISMARSISLSLIFLILALWCLERKHFRSLFFVAFAYIWSYQAAIALLPMSLAALAWWRWRGGIWAWQAPLYVTCGLLAGMTLNPFVPSTFPFFAFHFSSAFPGQGLIDVPKIPEWYGTTLLSLWQRNYPALLLGLIVPLLALPAWKRWPRDIGILAMGTCALFGVSIYAERFLEYGVPFAVLLGARLIDSLLINPQQHQRPKFLLTPFGKRSFALVLALVLVSIAWFGTMRYRDFYRHAFDISPHQFRAATHWLQQNTPRGTLVYHTDWAEFSYLFFYNTHNYYLAGLSPLFMAGWKPSIFQAYQMINRGLTKHPAKLIKKLFRAQYVVLHARTANMPLARQLLYDPQVKEVFGDHRVKILYLGPIP